ncbi:M20/M25/M40 family metallo-hydrolase [Actinokineospora auranticolor]|uniref:Acetylornithine deacetylase/succinyl-diaminopimelate desuccinylase-like protein n=1 Tax=Actinokineospora auranticolor TaxID=155976 RepID=A0A2S6GFS0_9PSEU|nr:M20/M25/M40 family metallo-hydrolase [Actinokineospora auranticolor]PPK64067.1 acetylornithine deacetylase/succinyl-diaminopimelate desuccinylase-like protein [Actinokineospora auranticolor]
MAAFTEADAALLLRLIDLPTAGPLETGEPARLWEALELYAAAAGGFTVAHHGPATRADLDRPGVPAAVREAARDPAFLAAQPSLVLRMGPVDAPTVMFNVHLDTVAGHEPGRVDGAVIHGRGAVDAKGPAVALLAGIRDAVSREPAIGAETTVLVQAVSGEEGGAMGTFGTRPLVERGFHGALNVFCEPTGLRYLPRATASATARIRVAGAGAVDDRPGDGHNATVLLGFLAQHLALELAGEHACVAGLHTGTRHNRVYGDGDLLVNLAYADDGERLTGALDRAVATGLARFRETFAAVPELARTAADAARVTTVDWLKRGLPALTGGDGAGALDELMAAAGIPAWPAADPAFTCDAIWLAGVPGAATAVLGPGDLAANHAHADGEFVALADLAAFAGQVSRLLRAFHARSAAR